MNASGTSRTTKQLFRQWRSGDAEAGGVMAQRFADWYFAMASSYLGVVGGAEPCRESCRQFSEQIRNVTDPANLVPWAHGLLREQLDRHGGRVVDGDEPSAYTGRQHPKQLLMAARQSIPEAVAAIQASFRRDAPELHPVTLLAHRYQLKRWLFEHANVPFKVVPQELDPDRAPLPLYEAGALKNGKEVEHFEHWMLTDMDLCQDITEFAPFAIALRGGLPSPAKGNAPTHLPQPHVSIQQQEPEEQVVVGILVAFLIGASLMTLFMGMSR